MPGERYAASPTTPSDGAFGAPRAHERAIRWRVLRAALHKGHYRRYGGAAAALRCGGSADNAAAGARLAGRASSLGRTAAALTIALAVACFAAYSRTFRSRRSSSASSSVRSCSTSLTVSASTYRRSLSSLSSWRVTISSCFAEAQLGGPVAGFVVALAAGAFAVLAGAAGAGASARTGARTIGTEPSAGFRLITSQ